MQCKDGPVWADQETTGVEIGLNFAPYLKQSTLNNLSSQWNPINHSRTHILTLKCKYWQIIWRGLTLTKQKVDQETTEVEIRLNFAPNLKRSTLRNLSSQLNPINHFRTHILALKCKYLQLNWRRLTLTNQQTQSNFWQMVNTSWRKCRSP